MADPFKAILKNMPEDGIDGPMAVPQSTDLNNPLTELQLDWAFNGLLVAYRSEMETRGRRAEEASSKPVKFEPTPFQWRDPSTLPRRGFSLEGVDPDLAAPRFVAWNIGNAVLNLIGLAALHDLNETFAAHFDSTHPGAWLNAVWSGVSNGRYTWAS